MVNTFNQCILIGAATNEPDIEFLHDRELVVRFTLLTDRLTGSDGATDCHQIVCHGKQAETALDFVTKGRTLQVVGQLTYRAWSIDLGEVARTAEILADRIAPLTPGPALCPRAGLSLHEEEIAA